MLTQKVEKALNEQIKREAFSSNLYLSMASWADTNGFQGSADWLYLQADEERMHMLKLFKYVNDREGKAIVSELERPESEFDSIKTVFEKVFEHEKYISASINELVGICMDERDFTTLNFLQWYVNEQIEEESNARAILDRISLLSNNPAQYYIFDKDIASFRTTTGE